MRLFLLLLGLIALLGGGGYWYLRAHPEAMPVLPIDGQLAQFDGLKQRVADVAQQARDRMFPGSAVAPAESAVPTDPSTSTSPPGPAPATGQPARQAAGGAQAASPTPEEPASGPSLPPPLLQLQHGATLYLTNGGVVTGELVRETPQEVVLRWDYGEVGFQRAEIKRIVKEVQSLEGDGIAMPWEGQQEAWPYHYDIVVKLKKGIVVDATLTTVTPETLVLTQTLSGGGEVEHTIRRDDVEELLFRPITNERSKQIEHTLQTIFPTMQWHTEGMFTIVTDSTPPTVRAYRRTVRELATEWYLTFFPLVQARQPQVQVYLVLFENWDSYIEYAATDGVPGWLAVGYFHPEEQVFYGFNMLGEHFSQLIFDAYLGQFRQERDRVMDSVKGHRYEDVIEGQLSEFVQTLEQAHAIARQTFGEIGTQILRHELTHSLFHNWQLQTVTLSQMTEADRERAQKKREYLTSTDDQKKRELLNQLIGPQEAGHAEPVGDVRAANAWFVEGLAGYMEPSPIGTPNAIRLAEFQEARHVQQLQPLPYLQHFKLGSFAGMSTQQTLYAYAQSWALCHFLMAQHREAFLAYLDRMVREPQPEGTYTLPWLLEAVGMDLPQFEHAFLAFMEPFPPEESLRVKQFKQFLDLRDELIALVTSI